MSGDDLAGIVERDFVAAWWLLAEAADVERVDSPALRYFHAGRSDPHCNPVLVTRLAGEEADETLDRVLATFRTRDAPGLWWVMPSSSPADLATRLRARGLEADAPWPGMAVRVADLIDPPPVPGLDVRRVTTREDFDRYVGVFAPILSPSPEFTDLFIRGARRIGFGMRAPEEHFLGMLEGEPVATASLLTAGGAAGIYNVTTVEAARGRGIGAAITAAAVRLGTSRGMSVATLQASTMGRSVYERLGFRFVCDFVPHRWSP